MKIQKTIRKAHFQQSKEIQNLKFSPCRQPWWRLSLCRQERRQNYAKFLGKIYSYTPPGKLSRAGPVNFLNYKMLQWELQFILGLILQIVLRGLQIVSEITNHFRFGIANCDNGVTNYIRYNKSCRDYKSCQYICKVQYKIDNRVSLTSSCVRYIKQSRAFVLFEQIFFKAL